MPLFNTIEARRLAERMHRLREKPFTAYGIAVTAVAIATLIRWAIGGYVVEGIPFAAYFPAIIIATLLGGFGPGVLATIVSGLVAWFLFLPPAFEFALTWPQGASILAFILISLLLVGLVTGLNSIVNRFLMLEQNLEAEIERCRYAERDARRLAAIVESSDDAIVAKDLNGIVTSWNQGAERLFGYTADEMVGKPVSILIPPDRLNEEPSILERLRRGQRIDHYETVRQHKDGSFIDISLTVSPVTDAEGTVIGASKIARDIRERKRAAEQQNMLIREMGHRVKNAFAVMGGLVSLSARSAATPEALAQQIQARLAALTRAHDLTRPSLLDSELTPGQSMTFHALVHAIFAPFLDSEVSTERERLIVKGPDVPIVEKSVTGLALLLHELATNAVKCGSLSSAKGCVRIDSSISNNQFLATWVEKGGPRLKEAPQHEGFGSFLARRIVNGQFGGQLLYDWKPEGLVVRLSVPLERLTK